MPGAGLSTILPDDRARRRWGWGTIAALVLLGVPSLWFAMAYGGLPRLWSRHEHKLIGKRDELVSYTAQDIPGDPINLRLIGERAAIDCAFRRAGWSGSDPVDFRSALGIAASVVFARPYPTAPVSPLYVADRMQEFAFQRDAGRSADKRHHIRFWQIGPRDWLAAATFDRGVGLSLFTLQVTHHIGRDVDAERNAAGALLEASGAQLIGAQSSRIAPGWHRNGGGDRYRTDGMIHVYRLGGCQGSVGKGRSRLDPGLRRGGSEHYSAVVVAPLCPREGGDPVWASALGSHQSNTLMGAFAGAQRSRRDRRRFMRRAAGRAPWARA